MDVFPIVVCVQGLTIGRMDYARVLTRCSCSNDMRRRMYGKKGNEGKARYNVNEGTEIVVVVICYLLLLFLLLRLPVFCCGLPLLRTTYFLILVCVTTVLVIALYC